MSSIELNSENACIAAFEDYFQGDWNDPYFKVERKQWQAAWGAATKFQQRQPLTNGEIYIAYITAANQTLRPQDERIVFAFTRAIEQAHGITGENK